MTHAIGRRAAAVIAAAVLGLGVASTAAAAAPAPTSGPAAVAAAGDVAPLSWWPYSFHRTSQECTDMRYYLRDLGYYSMANSKCNFHFGEAEPWWLSVNS